MKFKTVSASAFKSVFEVLKDIINDVNIVFTSDGMRILTLDHAHVAMVDMYKVLKNISGTDNTLTMEITTNEYLDILIENPSRKTKTRLKLLDIDENDIEEPQIKMDITTVLPSSEFQRICRDMRQLNENGNVTITRDNNKFKIAIEGDFANQETIIDCPQSQFKGNISALYDLGYLNTFTKASGICASVQIMQEFRNRFLILKYNVANLGELVFYLSSKVTGESDEDQF